jgi:nitrous oxidase accessory protein NosD
MAKKAQVLVFVTMLLAGVFFTVIPAANATVLEVGSGKPYSTIQAAVDAANPGDTILVYEGNYTGAIVDKNVTISGVSGFPIIADGVPYKVGSTLTTAFRLDDTADGAEIKNFVVNCNSTEGYYFAIFSRNADGITIDSLTVNDAVQGITNWGGSNWEIANNVLNDTEAAGGGGIAIWLGALPPGYFTCSGNIVRNNIITATATAPDYTCPGIGVGLDLRYGAYDLLTGYEDLSNNQILNNTITAPGALNGVGIEMGVLGLEENATKIAATLGIIDDNTIQGNHIEGADIGVYFYTVTDLEILANEIEDCNEGFHITGGSSGNIINYNNIVGNVIGVNNTADGIVDTRYNWWGDATGPYHGVTNLSGQGDEVGNNVTYCPWLYEPYPSGSLAHLMYAYPSDIQYWTPAECSNFTVDVMVENITRLYGFEFKLSWNNSLVDLLSIDVRVDQIWTTYFIGANQTWIDPDGTGWYYLVAAATAPSGSFNGTDALVSLLFHVKYDPCYIQQNFKLQTTFHFVDVKLSDSNADPIPVFIQDGLYTISASKPKLEIRPASNTARKLNETFEVGIWLINATKVYDYNFTIAFNKTYLTATEVIIDEGFLEGPYTESYYRIDLINGQVELRVVSQTPANGDGRLATIRFRAIASCVWKKDYNNTLNDDITFVYWELSVKCPNDYTIAGDLVDTDHSEYWFLPIKGDLDSDGAVNIIDLRKVAKYLNQDVPPAPAEVDLNDSGNIDIFDLVIVTSNFGYTYDP